MLFAAAVLIFSGSLLYIDKIARNIAEEERDKIRIWADAINKKAALVNATDTFFTRIQEEERHKVELWAKANQHSIMADLTEDVTLYLDLMEVFHLFFRPLTITKFFLRDIQDFGVVYPVSGDPGFSRSYKKQRCFPLLKIPQINSLPLAFTHASIVLLSVELGQGSPPGWE